MKIINIALLALVTLVCLLMTLDMFNSIASGESRQKLADAKQVYADSLRDVKQAEEAVSKKAPQEFTLWQITQGESKDAKESLRMVERLHRPGVVYPMLLILVVACLSLFLLWIVVIKNLIKKSPGKMRVWQ